MNQIKNSDIKSAQTSICPVTGLPIIRRPEWTDVILDKNYEVTLSILGHSIFYSQASGYGTLSGVKKALNLSRNIVPAEIDGDRPYIRIEDFSNLQGTSLESRKYFIDHMKKDDRLLGLIFCNASPLLKLSIKLAKRFNIVEFQVDIVNDYSEAVRLALKILSTNKIGIADSLSDFTPKPPVLSQDAVEPLKDRGYDHEDPPLKTIINPDWLFQSDDYSLRFEVIDSDILHGITTGLLKKEHIEPSLKMQENITRSMGLPKGDYFYVLSLKDSKGTGRKVRKIYIDAILELYEKYPFHMFIFYGASRFLRAAISLARPFVLFKVRVVKDLDSALSLITELKSKDTKPLSMEPAENEAGDPLESKNLKQYIDELLHFLGSINWEVDGFDESWGADLSHPLKPVFDAIAVIKMDLDELYQERKNADKEQKRLQGQLQRAQKMEAIGTLAGGVAHDLNNVLAGLVSYPDLLLLEIPEESPLREPILTIQKSGQKAAAIVQDLLTLARRGVAVTEVLNLNDIISDYLKSPEYEKLMSYHPQVELETDLGRDLSNISGSPVHLSKTVMNLVSNGAEAMPDGGKIFISTQNRYVDRPIRGYDKVEEGDYVILKVSDRGIGISPEDMERIFEPFYTKKVMGRSGTGLGMAVVWGTVKDHNGYIDVQSVKGKETAFTLFFPVTRKALTKDNPRLSSEYYMGNGESVLVVDDVEEQRNIALAMLQKMGYSVTSVSSGEEAVDYMKNNSADLMVLDMIMDPGMDGLETYKKILELHPGQKAIIVSGFSETDRVKEAQRLGAGSYVKKPYLIEKIGVAVREEFGK